MTCQLMLIQAFLAEGVACMLNAVSTSAYTRNWLTVRKSGPYDGELERVRSAVWHERPKCIAPDVANNSRGGHGNFPCTVSDRESVWRDPIVLFDYLRLYCQRSLSRCIEDRALCFSDP